MQLRNWKYNTNFGNEQWTPIPSVGSSGFALQLNWSKILTQNTLNERITQIITDRFEKQLNNIKTNIFETEREKEFFFPRWIQLQLICNIWERKQFGVVFTASLSWVQSAWFDYWNVIIKKKKSVLCSLFTNSYNLL